MELGTGEAESLRLKVVLVSENYDDRRWETDIIQWYIQKRIQCRYTVYGHDEP